MTFMLGLESYRDRTRSTVEEPSAPPPTRRRGIEAVPRRDFPKLAGHAALPPLSKVSAHFDDALSKPSGADPFDLVSPPR
ncbi:MAG: hypothetical protein WCC90_01910 [Methylocella sp.]